MKLSLSNEEGVKLAMVSKIVTLLLLSTVICSAILAVFIATNASQKSETTTTIRQEDSAVGQHLIPTSGDPVGGGGTPKIGQSDGWLRKNL